MKIQLHENFHPTEETWQKVEEAVENGLTSFTILSNGSIINSDNELKVWFGPVVGEVTEASATIVIETSCASESCFPLTCQLFAKNEDDQEEDPIQEMEKDVTSRRPHAFKFENLIPDTQYTVWFSTSPSPTMASFKTKKENMDNFRLIALSCDRYALCKSLTSRQIPFAKKYFNFSLLCLWIVNVESPNPIQILMQTVLNEGRVDSTDIE